MRLEGDYELFETTHKHRILVLNGDKWFAWVKGQKGDILVHSDSDHEKDRTLQKGRYFFADFEDDDKFVDQPHLFLLEGDSYQELLLPNGLPTDKDHQKKLVVSDETVAKAELEKHLGKS